MKKTIAFWLLSVGIVALSALLFEGRSQADPNGKACKGTADCTHGCERVDQQPTRFYCNKIVTTGDAGKKCDTGEKTDNCEDKDTVLCGMEKGKTCAGPPAAADCGSPTDIGEVFNSGCK